MMNKKFNLIDKVEEIPLESTERYYKYKKCNRLINEKIKNYISIFLISLFVMFVILGYINK